MTSKRRPYSKETGIHLTELANEMVEYTTGTDNSDSGCKKMISKMRYLADILEEEQRIRRLEDGTINRGS